MYDKTIGYWNEKKEKIKHSFPVVPDDDLDFPEGKEREMVDMLGYKLGKTIEEIRAIIASI